MVRAMSVLGNTKSDSHRKTHGVKPDGAGRKSCTLPWGGPDVRAPGSQQKHSAWTPAERREERRAEGQRECDRSTVLEGRRGEP